MESGYTLIDRAASTCGSRYKLAMQLGESLSFLGRVASGKAPMPPSLAARLAVIAGIDARRAALEALVSQEKDPAKRAALEAALGVTVPYPDIQQPEGRLLHTIVYASHTTVRRIVQLFRLLPLGVLPQIAG